MNITQAAQIYQILVGLSEDDPFWGPDYPKARCLRQVQNGYRSLESWYTNEKQYHWGTPYRRKFIDQQLDACR